MARAAAFAYESPRDGLLRRYTRSLPSVYSDGEPPRSRAAISCSFSRASVAPARFARVIACVVWLPTDMQLHGRFFEVLPQLTTIFSHGMARTSPATRARSIIECVPRLPTPDCTYR